MEKAALRDFVIEVVRRIDKEPGFKVLPRRWVIERTFRWMPRWRRLLRDYEQRIDVSTAFIHVAMGSLLLRRISQRTNSQTDYNVAVMEFAETFCWTLTTEYCRACAKAARRPWSEASSAPGPRASGCGGA
jgi:hypothetical protein